MEFLQIWIGKKPNRKIMACIKSVRKQLRKKDTYTLISNTNFLEDDSINWIPYKEYIKKIKKDKITKDFWKYFNSHKYKAINTTISDVIRFHYAINHKNVLYIDTDVKLKSLPKFDNNQVYFSPHGRKTFDYYMFYNGNNNDLFKKILESSIYRVTEIENIDILKSKIWIFKTMIRSKLTNEIKKIDKEHYVHLNLGKDKI